MNTQMYPFLRIAIVLVAGIMVGDMLYGHVPVRVVFWVLAVLLCATIVAYRKSGNPLLTTSLLMLDVFVLGIWNVGRVEQRLDVPLNRDIETIEAVVAERSRTAHNKVCAGCSRRATCRTIYKRFLSEG